ncbi:hypothetical protein B0H16DRAFT_428395 [Mycena metata]|uniref:C2H2-type domain-containing protein n=1 Tax=Mycena metata TaxID=1033252 RepID=A0AAD7NKS6_9AGAR|nr:hypothetical protein B0H16DRAFT_428395 [Mycena metata]
MSHPIALPMPVASSHQQQQDAFPMSLDGGSYTGEDGRAFNPASYTRHFLGSPISWRAGSFGATYCATSTSPTAMLVGSYELGPAGPGRSPLKSPDSNSILNAWNVFDRQGELCRNYTCCGAHLPDLHALLEHFEEVHIVVRGGQPPSIQIPFNPQMNPPEPATHASDTAHLLQQPQYSTPFDTDDMDLGEALYDVDVDVDDSSPPPPSTAPTSTVTSRAPSPSPASPMTAHLAHAGKPALNISLSGVGFPPSFQPHSSSLANAHGHGHGAHTPFSAYARYNAEYSPGGGTTQVVTPQDVAEYTPSPPDSSAHNANANVGGQGAFGHEAGSAIAPALVFGREGEDEFEEGPVASTSAIGQGQMPSGSQGGKVPKAKSSARGSGNSNSHAGGSRSAPPSRLGTPPGFASGSGAQSAHPSSAGQNSFSAHLASSSSSASHANLNGGANSNSNSNLNSGGVGGGPTILLPHKPFRCPKPNCSKSYKQANGLKYHITHGSCNYGPAKDLEAVRALLERKRAANASANSNSMQGGGEEDHGAVGLGMLAGGVHGCLKNNNSSSHSSHSNSHPANSHPNSNSASGASSHNTLNSPTTPGTPTGAGKNKAGTGMGAGAYAWGSTLLPHIQAVSATTATTAATAIATASTTTASTSPGAGAGGKKGGKGKTEATAFTVPGAGAGVGAGAAKANASGKASSAPGTPVGSTSTFPAVPVPAGPTASAPAPNSAQGQGQTQAEYLAQLQRAQYAQYQQWYVSAQQQAQAQAAAVQAQVQAQAQQQAQAQRQGQGSGSGQDVTMG